MKTPPLIQLFMTFVGVVFTHALSAQSAAFTYQGRFTENGEPFTGDVEFQFILWDAGTNGDQVALTEPEAMVVSVTNGLFSVSLDFGAEAFDGSDRWLGILARTSIGAFTTLTPRQRLTPTPYAIAAGGLTSPLPTSQLQGTLPSEVLSGTYDSVLSLSNPANRFAGDAAGLTGLNASALADGTVPDARLGSAIARTRQVWLLDGNDGTAPGPHFLGTVDDQPLELKVNGLRALRVEDNGDGGDGGSNPDGAPNMIGGAPVNLVAEGVVGATIAGGGATNWAGIARTNAVLADYGSVLGGIDNTASGVCSTAMGRSATASGDYASTIGFGTIASGNYSTARGAETVASGAYSTATGASTEASGLGSTAMGQLATAGGDTSVAMGFRAKANHDGSFVWGDSQAADISSHAVNSMTFRCAGGARFLSGTGGANQQVTWGPGLGSWVFSSDRNLKDGFQPVDTQAVMEKVCQLPITEWNYKGYPERHIGPMAQDFHAAFPLNDSTTTLNDADLHGVALAAIQGLNRKLEERLKWKETEIAELRMELADLKTMVSRLAKP